MPVTDEEVEGLIAAMDLGRARWVNGQGEFSADAPFRQADDMTIFGPFGAPSPDLRHADPLIVRRPLDATLVLLEDG